MKPAYTLGRRRRGMNSLLAELRARINLTSGHARKDLR